MIGFTGTRNGCTFAQLKSLAAVLQELRLAHIFMENGACEGADRQAAELWLALNGGILFSPGDQLQYLWALNQPNSQVNKPRPYLERNKIIANRDVLVATPKEMQEVLRSGTWSTIRYARRMSRPRFIIFPDGSHTQD